MLTEPPSKLIDRRTDQTTTVSLVGMHYTVQYTVHTVVLESAESQSCELRNGLINPPLKSFRCLFVTPTLCSKHTRLDGNAELNNLRYQVPYVPSFRETSDGLSYFMSIFFGIT